MGKKYVIRVIACLVIIITFVNVIWKYKKKVAQLENERNRFKNQFDLLCQWNRNNLCDDSLDKLLKERKINTIAIYGKGVIGRLIFHALENTEVKVTCFIDRNAANVIGDLAKTITVEQLESESKPDAIIVSLPYDFFRIKKDLLEFLGEEYEIIVQKNCVFLKFVKFLRNRC